MTSDHPLSQPLHQPLSRRRLLGAAAAGLVTGGALVRGAAPAAAAPGGRHPHPRPHPQDVPGRTEVTLPFGVNRGALHAYPAGGAFSAVDDQPLFFRDGKELVFLKSSPTDSHGWNTRWTGTSMDDLAFDTSFTIDVPNTWLAGQGWVDTDGTWYCTGIQEWEYDANNLVAKTSGGGKTYFHRQYAFASTDKGLTWHSKGEIVSAKSGLDWDSFDRWQAQDWGPGPATLFVDERSGYFYFYYPVGWRAWETDARYTFVGVARSAISDKMAPGTWYKYYDGGWHEPGLGGRESAVLAGALNTGVTWNSYLGRYLALGAWESAIGTAGADRHLWIATATDLGAQNWTKGAYFRRNGNGWYYWITDTAGTTDSPTGQNLRLYYGNEGQYQDVTLDRAGTFTGYSWPQTLPDHIVPEPAWNGLTNRPDRTRGAAYFGSGTALPGTSLAQAFDEDVTTSWGVQAASGTLGCTFPGTAAYAVALYGVTSAADHPEYDPAAWTLQGSNDGMTWTTVDARTGQSFTERSDTLEFPVANPRAFRRYRLDITASNGGSCLQVGELRLYAGGTTFDTGSRPAPVGHQLWLKSAANGKIVTAVDTTGTPLHADSAGALARERFTVTAAGSGGIALLAANGRYVTVDTTTANGPLRATASQVGATETFQWVPQPSGQVALKAAGGAYVTAWLNAAGTPLQARSTTVGTWECFLPYWPRDLALGQLALAAASSSVTGEEAAYCVDGSGTTKASTTAADGDGAWIKVGLGRRQPIGNVRITWGSTAYAKDYRIQVSDDAATWHTVSTVTGNASGGARNHALPTGTTGAHVRMLGVTRADPGYGYTIVKLEVEEADDLAGGCPVHASSTGSDGPPDHVTDGSDTTKFTTAPAEGDGAWVHVDLGSSKSIADVRLTWGKQAYGKDYRIQVSDDAATWRTASTVTGNTSGGARDHFVPSGTTGRYVRMQGTTRASTAYGYTLIEFEVF